MYWQSKQIQPRWSKLHIIHGFYDIWLCRNHGHYRKHTRAKAGSYTTGFLLYPNPATTTTWLQLPEHTAQSPMQLQLISPRGGVVYVAAASGVFISSAQPTFRQASTSSASGTEKKMAGAEIGEGVAEELMC